MVWDTCAANHGPTTRKRVSPKGVSRLSQDFFKVPKSVILQILRRLFEQRQDSPGRERIYFRQMFTVDLKNWCPNVQIGFHLFPAGRLCRDFHLVTENQNHSLTSTATVENPGAEYAGKGRPDGRHHVLPPERHCAKTHF